MVYAHAKNRSIILHMVFTFLFFGAYFVLLEIYRFANARFNRHQFYCCFLQFMSASATSHIQIICHMGYLIIHICTYHVNWIRKSIFVFETFKLHLNRTHKHTHIVHVLRKMPYRLALVCSFSLIYFSSTYFPKNSSIRQHQSMNGRIISIVL